MSNHHDLGTSIHNWLSRISQSEDPPDEVIAFNIGLFRTGGGYCAYLMGSAWFDPDHDDWACTECFTPQERYMPLPRRQVGRAEWNLIVSKVAQATRDFIRSDEGRNSFLARRQAMTVGFDEGELIRIY